MECPSEEFGCSECTHNICIECFDGFYRFNGTCNDCTTQRGCEQCSRGDMCEVCDERKFFLKNGECYCRTEIGFKYDVFTNNCLCDGYDTGYDNEYDKPACSKCSELFPGC